MLNKLNKIILLLTILYLSIDSYNIKLLLIATICTYSIINIFTLLKVMYLIIKSTFINGLIETIQEMQSVTDEYKDNEKEFQNKREELKRKIFKYFKQEREPKNSLIFFKTLLN